MRDGDEELAALSERYKIAVAKLRQSGLGSSSSRYVTFDDLAFILEVVSSSRFGEFVGFQRPVENSEWQAIQETVKRAERLAALVSLSEGVEI